MTDRDVDATVDSSDEERPASSEEAAEIVRNDPALSKATEHSSPTSSPSRDDD